MKERPSMMRRLAAVLGLATAGMTGASRPRLAGKGTRGTKTTERAKEAEGRRRNREAWEACVRKGYSHKIELVDDNKGRNGRGCQIELLDRMRKEATL